MSSRFELLGKYDVKENRFSRVEIRDHINKMYNQLDVLKLAMTAHVDCEDLFGEYFEQFEVEYIDLMAIIGFMYEIKMINSGTHDGILYKLDEMLQEVTELFKKVYCSVEE